MRIDDDIFQNVTLREATWVWAKIGLLSFGGPAGQIALMHRILVDEKRWISEQRFLHALNFCMVLPGPEAQQLATYIGWLMHRIRGGLIAGVLFILPGFAVILALSTLYVTAGSAAIVQGLFVGLKSAVIVIVLQAVIRIGRRSLKSPMQSALAVVAFFAMFVWKIQFPYVILVAAIVGAITTRLSKAVPTDTGPAEIDLQHMGGIRYVIRCVVIIGFLWLAPTALLVGFLGPDNVFSNIGTFFSKMAVVTFGGAYAVLAYVSQEAVVTYSWLAPGEMIDGLALAETTPGPLIMVTQFVGFVGAYRDPGELMPLVAASLGGLLTTWVTFAPCFLWIFVGAPYIEGLRRNCVLAGALSGVTAAVVGVIGNLALWFSIHSLFSSVTLQRYMGQMVEVPVVSSISWPSLFITSVASVLVFGVRASVLTTLAVTGALGVAWYLL